VADGSELEHGDVRLAAELEAADAVRPADRPRGGQRRGLQHLREAAPSTTLPTRSVRMRGHSIGIFQYPQLLSKVNFWRCRPGTRAQGSAAMWNSHEGCPTLCQSTQQFDQKSRLEGSSWPNSWANPMCTSLLWPRGGRRLARLRAGPQARGASTSRWAGRRPDLAAGGRTSLS
jgi:hypothetical protein